MKKKILFLQNELGIGGAQTILIHYLNIIADNPEYEVTVALVDANHNQEELNNISKVNPKVEFIYILNDIETQFGRYLNDRLRDNTLSAQTRNYYQSWHNYISKELQERVLKTIELHQYDVVIDFLCVLRYFFTEEYIEKLSIPIIAWIHNSSDFYGWLNNKSKHNVILNKYSGFVSICEDMQKQCNTILKNEFNIHNKLSSMLFNPVDHNKILFSVSQDILDGDRRLLQDNFIVQVARLYDGHKNHSEMIDIFYKLKQKGIKEKLYIIGDGPSRSALSEKIKALKLENECLLLGSRENPFPFMRYAKLFIHTANYEGLPTVLIESMICGTPVVSYDCPTGPKEILENGKYGELIPMGNSDLFVTKVYELLTNEDKRQHFIQLLPESIERFNMESIGKQFFKLIETVIKDLPKITSSNTL